MKRLLILLLTLTFLLGLAACSDAPEPTPEPSPEPSAEPSAEPSPEGTPIPSSEPEPSAPLYAHPLTGEPLETAFPNTRPYAVMINNINVAQPQCSTSQCDILYEILAEGTTRMMAIFSDLSDVGSIGSMRSLRPYYLDVATTYDAIMIHAGGSEQAYSDLKTKGVENIDGVRGPGAGAFARDPSRQTYGIEHSLFTTGEQLLAATADLSYRTEHEGESYDYGLRFVADGTPGGASAGTIDVHFGAYKNTTFTYDPDTKLYYPAQYGSDYIDGNTGEPVGFTNVLVLYAETRTLDNYGRLAVTLTGSGDGHYACGGKSTFITWSREAEGALFEYTKADGSPLSFGIGTTYICIVPTGSEVTIS